MRGRSRGLEKTNAAHDLRQIYVSPILLSTAFYLIIFFTLVTMRTQKRKRNFLSSVIRRFLLFTWSEKATSELLHKKVTSPYVSLVLVSREESLNNAKVASETDHNTRP